MKNRATKLSQSGSLVNFMMGHNDSVPVVGKGATELLYSDRHAYEVLAVDEKKKTVVLQRYAPKRVDNLGMSEMQDYEYKEFAGEPFTLYYKWGSWKTKSKVVHFTEEAIAKYGIGPKLHEAFKNAGGTYNGAFIASVVPGLTKEHTEWCVRNFLFGHREEYYDFSF